MARTQAAAHKVNSSALTDPHALLPGFLRRLAVALARVVDGADRRLSSQPVYLTAAALLAAIQVALIVTHKPWLDEVQALLIAVQPGTFAQVFEQLHYEGHPGLWYLLLRATAAAVPYDWVLRSASLLIAGLFWWTVLASDRFGRAEKLLLLASALILVEYTAISRSLGLGVAIFFLALHWWRRPWAWVAIALLPQCDFLFGVLSAMLVLVRLRDGYFDKLRLPLAGLALWLISSALAAVAVVPAPDLVSDAPRPLLYQLNVFLSQLGALAVPVQFGPGGIQWNQTLLPGILALPATIGLVALLPGKRLGDRWLAIGLVLFVYLFSTFVYPLYFRHVTLIAVWLIGAYWIDSTWAPRRRIAWRAWLLAMAIAGGIAAEANFLQPFDTGEDFAAEIEHNRLGDALIVSYPDWHSIAVGNALGRPLGGLERGCASSFIRWDTEQVKPMTREVFNDLVERLSQRVGGFYLITPAEIRLPAGQASLIARRKAGYSGMSYALWKVGDEGSRVAALEPCVDPGLPG